MQAALKYLFPGIDLSADVVIEDDGKGPRIAKWLRPEKQPTPEELQAAEPAALAAQQAEAVKVAESTTARDEAKQAYSAIEPLRSHKDPAIALIADVMCKHLLATLGR